MLNLPMPADGLAWSSAHTAELYTQTPNNAVRADPHTPPMPHARRPEDDETRLTLGIRMQVCHTSVRRNTSSTIGSWAFRQMCGPHTIRHPHHTASHSFQSSRTYAAFPLRFSINRPVNRPFLHCKTYVVHCFFCGYEVSLV